MLFEIQKCTFKKIYLKTSSAKWRPFCFDLNVLIVVSGDDATVSIVKGISPSAPTHGWHYSSHGNNDVASWVKLLGIGGWVHIGPQQYRIINHTLRE